MFKTRLFQHTCLSLFVMLLCYSGTVFSQSNARVAGKVVDDKDSAVVNASIVVKGTANGTTTDQNGNFSLAINNPKAVLVISVVGYQSQEVALADRTEITVRLTTTSSNLTDVVVVGYGTQKKVTVTGAVATVKGSELQKSPTVNLSNSLAGRLPGVTAIQAGGEPGFDGSTIRVRGTNTFGNSSALIVIDGIPDRAGGLDRINPADVESMSVLKDASAAIYGARAANGVILITTKRGKNGKPNLLYDFNHGWSQPSRIPKMADNLQYAEMSNELVLYKELQQNPEQWAAGWQALESTGQYTVPGATPRTFFATFRPDDFAKFRDGSSPLTHPNTDWFDATNKTWSPQVRHNMQVSGGTDAVKYLGSVGYQNQDGYYKNSATGYKQYDVRLNIDAKVNKYINIGVGILAREENREFPTEPATDIFRMQMRGKPSETAVWPDGRPGPDIENGENPVVITTGATGYDRDKRTYIQTNGKIEILIPGVEGLKITGTAAFDKYNLNRKRWATPWTLYFWDKKTFEADGVTPKLEGRVRSTFPDPRLNQYSENSLNVNLIGMLNYDRKFSDHTIGLLAGVQKETNEGDGFNVFRRYFLTPEIDQINVGGADEQTIGGSAFTRARLSYFGRVNYNYKEKYLFEFLWRYDGSYMFHESNRFGFFPGLLAGWNISEENFFAQNVKFINNLKIRASYGQMGNDQVYFGDQLQEFAYLGTYTFDTYILNNSLTRTLNERIVPNPDFSWEIANNLNLGLEGSALNNKLNFEFEFFYNKRDKILVRNEAAVPNSSGIADKLPPVPLGKLDNKGWEFKVGYSDMIGDFRYTVSANGGYAKNRILAWPDTKGIPEYQKAVGRGFGTSGVNFLVYESDGVFRDQKDIDANTIDYSAATSKLIPGDMKFKDMNNDKKINADDRVSQDWNRDPIFTGGLNINLGWKNFDLSILFQGAAGGRLYINTESGDIGNYLEYTYKNRWTVENPSSEHPRIANRGGTYYTGGGYGSNTYYFRKSDYVRLKNVELGYNLPAAIGSKVGLQNARIYVNGLNLITWDQMKIWDPEATSNNGQYYPQARILSVGARVTF
ncbi:SusC/RagA family TonB-linked outer membrane protein [Flavitalea sp.]|nr:TonB-dependent receptor [Flavitalea sp.]